MRNFIGPILSVAALAIMVVIGENLPVRGSMHPGKVGGEQAARFNNEQPL